MIVEIINTQKADISSFESKYGVELPRDYRSFLEKNNGCISQDDTSIFIADLNAELEIDSLFGLGSEREWLNIDFWMGEYGRDLPVGSVIFGCDLLKGLFVWINDAENGGVYYWDDTLRFPKSSDESNAYYVCATFGDFLNLLGGVEPI